MQKKINVEYSILFDDQERMEGKAVVELWTGKVTGITVNQNNIKEKVEDGYFVEGESISFRVGEKEGGTTIVYDAEEKNGEPTLLEEKRQEMVGWVKTFPESFTSPEPEIASVLGNENTSTPIQEVKNAM